MTEIHVDATTLIALGTVDELELLANFDGEVFIPKPVIEEVTSEPAATSLERFMEECDPTIAQPGSDEELETARDLLGDDALNGDVRLIAAVLTRDDVAVVSDDRRVRTTARTLGARVTGTIGVVVRGVDEGLTAAEGKELVRRIDGHGLHMTGELRDRAFALIDDAATE